MPQPFDASAKFLLSDQWLKDWLPLSGRPPGRVESVSNDLSTVTAQADRILRVDATQPWIWHLELQANKDPQLGDRLHHYNALLDYQYDLPIWTTVLLLRKQADHPQLTGSWQRTFGTEAPYRVFRYQVLRLWELAPESLLDGGLGVVPLAPLAAVPEGKVPQVVQRVHDRIAAEASGEEANRLWTATSVLFGLRFPDTLIANLLEGVSMLEEVLQESSFFRLVMEKGHKKGWEQGLAEGRQKGQQEGRLEGLTQGKVEGEWEALHRVIVKQGRRRFGDPDEKTSAQLQAIQDLARLERMVEMILEANSWTELLATP